MKIIMTERKQKKHSGKDNFIKNNSTNILLFSIFAAGCVTGGVLFNSNDNLMYIGKKIFILNIFTSMSLVELIIVFVIMALSVAVFLFSSGLCLIGYPGIYACPFVSGFIISIAFCALSTSSEPLKNIKSILMLPGTAALICFIIILCNYASDMVGSFSGGSIGVIKTKNYILKFIIITSIIVALFIIQSLIIMLLRHLN